MAAVALLAVNLYVQSHSTQARIQDELSQRLGTTLRIQRISVTPWWGLKLTGITMPQEDGTGEFLRAQTFRLRVAIASLFTQRLVIKEVSLIKPSVVWAQNTDGKWRLPNTLGADEADDSAAPAEAAPSPPDVASGNAPYGPAAAAAEKEEAAERFTPEVRRVRLTDGSFRFLDEKKKPVATFTGVGFKSDLRNADDLRGNVTIAKTSLRDRFFLERLRSSVRYDATKLEFYKIHAASAGGEVTGKFRVSPNSPESPFAVEVNFQGLDANRLINDAGGPDGMLEGRLEGRLQANGQTSDPNALTGTGEIVLHEGRVQRYSLLVALAQLLRLEDLQQLEFHQAHVRYHINPGVVTIDDLVLSSPSIRLSAKGTVGFDGQLQLDSRLAINDAVRGQLFRPIRSSFQRLETEAGFAALDFRVTGTIERPRTDLLDKLVGPELKGIGDVISGFLDRKKGDRPKRKRPAAEDAVAEPAAPEPPAPPVHAPEPAATP
jgi:type II secretion system protein N